MCNPVFSVCLYLTRRYVALFVILFALLVLLPPKPKALPVHLEAILPGRYYNAPDCRYFWCFTANEAYALNVQRNAEFVRYALLIVRDFETCQIYYHEYSFAQKGRTYFHYATISDKRVRFAWLQDMKCLMAVGS